MSACSTSGVLISSHVSTQVVLTIIYEVGAVLIPILQERRLRHREVKQLQAKVTEQEVKGSDSVPGSLAPEPQS